MNILFLLRGTGIGGLEVVTSVLANQFASKGHKVSLFIFRREDGPLVTTLLSKEIKICQYHQYSCNVDSIRTLRQFVEANHVQLIINQWGLPLVPIKVARKATRGLHVPIISVYHNSPDANGRIQGINLKLAQTRSPFKHALLKCVRYAFKQVTSYSMRYNYRQSDVYLVLSESYRNIFQDFTRLRETPKLRVMVNPITLDKVDFTYKAAEKKKEILYVGRLDAVQKCVHRVLDTWAFLESRHPDWKLTIVGDGPDRQNLEAQVASIGLERVSFEGFQKPLPYYQRASILVLTSDFEGFPLVLAEAMSCGVVPVVYDSFAAVRDIIDTGKDGIIVPKEDNGFSVEAMAKGIGQVIEDCETTRLMARAAIAKSKNYSIEAIYENWMGLFQELGIRS